MNVYFILIESVYTFNKKSVVEFIPNSDSVIWVFDCLSLSYRFKFPSINFDLGNRVESLALALKVYLIHRYLGFE